MSATALRKPAVLPFINIYTVFGLLILCHLALTVYLKLLWGEATGVEYLYLLMLLQATPVVIAFTRRHFTYIAFIMVFHFFQLSLPKWFLFQENPALAETFPEVLMALKEMIFCTGIVILVYQACRTFLFAASVEKERFQFFTLTTGQVVFLSMYVVFVPMFLGYLPAWFLSIHFLLLSADVVLLFTSNSPGNSWLIRLTKTAAIIGSMTYFLNTGMMTLMVALVSLSALVFCLKKRFRMLLIIAVAVIGMSAIQTVKGTYRILIRDPEVPLSTLERAGILWELIAAKYIYDEETDLGDEDDGKPDDLATNLISGFMRAGDDSLDRVLAQTPSKVPFWNGETYANIPYIFIPRALWRDKPTRHFWNKYGRTYGILSAEDYQTSVGVSYFAEAYMNFGYGGMYLCAVLVGFIFAFVEKSAFFIFGGHFHFPYIVLLTPLLAPASDLGSMINSLWVIYIVFLIGRPLLLRMARRDEYS